MIADEVFRTFRDERVPFSFLSGKSAIEVRRLKVFVPAYWIIICAIFNVNPFKENSYIVTKRIWIAYKMKSFLLSYM